jgi:hypothetical protein
MINSVITNNISRTPYPARSLRGDAALFAFVPDWAAVEACPETLDPEGDADPSTAPEPDPVVPFVDDLEFLSAKVGNVMSLSAYGWEMLSAVAKGTTAWKADLIAGAYLMNSDMVKLSNRER